MKHFKVAGFSLIELVFAIALVGILAALAVPVFVNLSNSANLAVVKGVAKGLQGGAELFQAKWYANGSVPDVPGYTSIANAQGIPVGIADDNIAHHDDCVLIWQDLLIGTQSPSHISGDDGWRESFTGGAWGLNASQLPGESGDLFCHFVYVAGRADNPMMVVYNISTGHVHTEPWLYTP